MENKSKELEVAIEAALQAGKILEKHQETEIERGVKEDKSMVTLADTESEEIIKKILLVKKEYIHNLFSILIFLLIQYFSFFPYKYIKTMK